MTISLRYGGLALVVLLAACPAPARPADATADGVADHGPDGSDGPPDEAVPCTPGRPCDDGVFCNGPEQCLPDGTCAQVAIHLPCRDGLACTDDRCDEGARACRFVPHDERCGPGETCDPDRGCQAPDGG